MHPDSYAMAIIAGLSLFPEISNLGADGLLQFEEGLSRELSVEGQDKKVQSFLNFVISGVPNEKSTVRDMLDEIQQRGSNELHAPFTRRPVLRLYLNFLSSWLYFLL